MSFNNMKKGIFILLLCFVLPFTVSAEPESLWNKLSTIAANGWMEASSLSSQEMDQLTALSKSGDSNAQYALGMIYQTKHDHDKAANWLKHAAEQGHVPAQYSYNKNAAGHPDMAQINW